MGGPHVFPSDAMTPKPATLSADLRRYTSSPKTYLRPFICPFDALLEMVPVGASVFDIGCGQGAWLTLVGQHRRPSKVAGYDVEPFAVAEASRLLATAFPGVPAKLQLWSEPGVPLDVSGYDIVTMIDVLHHVPPDQQQSILDSTFRNMRRGSVLILKDIDGASPLVWFNRLHDRVVSGAAGHELSSAKVVADLTKAGFVVGAPQFRHMLFYPHFWCKAVKPN